MMTNSIAGIFGPHSVDISDHVQSLCDAMEIPHIEMRWDSRQRRGSCLVNLFPHPTTISKVRQVSLPLLSGSGGRGGGGEVHLISESQV